LRLAVQAHVDVFVEEADAARDAGGFLKRRLVTPGEIIERMTVQVQ
jgi:hypothetical protein